MPNTAPDDREDLLDTLALLASAFSRVVRERGGNPMHAVAYQRAMRVLTRDLVATYPEVQS